MRLTVLNVAYPLAPVGADAVGGAEQVLATLDRALVAAGHRSLVMAQTGSRVAGELLEMPAVTGEIDDAIQARLQRLYAGRLGELLARGDIDLVHMHSVDFHRCLPPAGVPVLATLHLPIDWYPREALHPNRPETFVHAVSAAQHRSAPVEARLLPPIENGIDVDGFGGRHARRGFALMLSRICPEKGVHLALDAARDAGVPLLVAGEVFPYGAHRRYFEDEVRPRLDRWRRYIGPVGLQRKRRLLAAARCVLIASTVAETSSLVAREALAAGTPVIAFARGALVDTLEPGRTGFLVQDGKEMAHAIARSGDISRETCRAAARDRFSDRAMIDRYLDLYHKLAATRLRGAA